jgi:hypothetical protein
MMTYTNINCIVNVLNLNTLNLITIQWYTGVNKDD